VRDKATVLDIDNNGEVLHVEIQQANGETVVGIFELVGWTKAPKDVKARVELELWVPPKVTYPIQ
jgi:uncharacterized protein YuzE